MSSIFDGPRMHVVNQKHVHQQHVNCYINIWVCISEPVFYGDLVYKFKRIVGKPSLSDKF